MFYLETHSIHFIYDYGMLDMWLTITQTARDWGGGGGGGENYLHAHQKPKGCLSGLGSWDRKQEINSKRCFICTILQIV